MHSEQFLQWRQSFQETLALERRFYRTVLDSARGLEPGPSDDLRRELAAAQARSTRLLQQLLNECAVEAASIRADLDANCPSNESRRRSAMKDMKVGT